MDRPDNSPAPILVTTALEETWGIDEPVVFLGEWCRLYDRRDVWTKRPHQIVRNHWGDRKKLRSDYDYLKRLHDSLLATLTQAFNLYHRIERPLRYWQMILDPWLLTYVAVVWDRWECIRLANEEHQFSETIAFDRGPSVTLDYNDFIEKALGDIWNHYLFVELLESGNFGSCRIRHVANKSGATGRPSGHILAKRGAKSIKYRLAQCADNFARWWSKRNSVVLFDAYFSPVGLARLNLKLGQWPRLHLQDFDPESARREIRSAADRLSSRANFAIVQKTQNIFEQFLLRRIVSDLPVAYMEGFDKLRAMTERINLQPKAILTATAHWGNELFKVWSAERVFNGARLVLMQHGGSFPPLMNVMDFEEDISDIRAIWIAPYNRKHQRLPPPKLVKIHARNERLAVIGLEIPRYNFRADSAPKSDQTLKCFDMICELHNLLSKPIQTNFLVRPYPNSGWNTQQRFIDRLGKDKVSCKGSFENFLSTARLIVCTYPQTTFSDAMATGLPTILLYTPEHWETIPETDSLLTTLKSAKILFDSPAAAASHIESAWNNPSTWWDSCEVAAARTAFHDQMLVMNGDWLKEWADFLKKLVK